MTEHQNLAGKTLLISGGSRGIGLAIALRAARAGANVALLAKTAEPHPKLPGTVFTAAAEIEAAGGGALPVVGDVRNEEDVDRAVAETVRRFGGIDIVVNNASAISLTKIADTAMKRYDLMHDINVRGSFLLAQRALPHLLQSERGHVLTLSPPLNLDPKWFGQHLAYTMSKYGMSFVTLGLAEELRGTNVSANSLWPKTLIATAAVQEVVGGDAAMARSRTPEIMADAAFALFTEETPRSGLHLIDEEVLSEHGVTDFERYRAQPGGPELELDIFLD